MAHEISSVSGKAEVFLGSNTPAWHDLGTVVDGTVNSIDALTLAGLDWEVAKTPIGSFKTATGLAIKSDDSVITRTALDGSLIHLGTVGKRYAAIQNKTAFDFFDSIIGEGSAHYETAGALFEGRKVWIMADIPSAAFGADSGDETKIKVMLANSHDGKGCLEAMVVPLRVVCWNIYSLALKGASNRVKIRHLANWNTEQKVLAAREILGITKTYGQLLNAKFDAFRAESISKDAFVSNFLDKLFVNEDTGSKRATTIWENKREEVIGLFVNGTGTEGKTVWDAFNSITEWSNHKAVFKATEGTSKAENRIVSILEGGSAKMNQKAFEIADSLVA